MGEGEKAGISTAYLHKERGNGTFYELVRISLLKAAKPRRIKS